MNISDTNIRTSRYREGNLGKRRLSRIFILSLRSYVFQFVFQLISVNCHYIFLSYDRAMFFWLRAFHGMQRGLRSPLKFQVPPQIQLPPQPLTAQVPSQLRAPPLKFLNLSAPSLSVRPSKIRTHSVQRGSHLKIQVPPNFRTPST